MAFAALGRVSPSYYTQDGVVPRSQIPAVMRHIGNVSKKYDLIIGNIFHAGDGNLHPLILFDMRNAEQFERVLWASRDILEFCIQCGGSITGEHGVGMEKRDLMSRLFTDEDLDVMISLRNAFNGNGILNPQKIFPTPRMCREITGPSQNPVLMQEGTVSTATTTARFAAEFRAICGAEYVTEDPAELQARNILGVTPALAVTPASADEVAGIFTLCQ